MSSCRAANANAPIASGVWWKVAWAILDAEVATVRWAAEAAARDAVQAGECAMSVFTIVRTAPRPVQDFLPPLAPRVDVKE